MLAREIIRNQSPPAAPESSTLVDWIPILLLPVAAVAIRNFLAPWVFMWILAVSIFASLKWLSWRRARTRVKHSAWRSAGYILAWPGMDAEAFLDESQRASSPPDQAWILAILETILGAILLWVFPRSVPPQELLLRGWLGMLGLILLLHFGSFQLVSLAWRAFGVEAKPIMSAPLRSGSLGEFWGKRWNLGFRQLAHELVFRPLHRKLGTNLAGFLVFGVSGIIHDLVISLPARGGYGLPMMYFLIQGAGVAIEHSSLGKWLGLRHKVGGWCFMVVFLVGPVFWLFHPRFVLQVILPFMQAVHAI